MKKLARILALALTLTLCLGLFAACNQDSGSDATNPPAGNDATNPPAGSDATNPPAGGEKKGTINLWAFTDEVPNMVARYKELHPEFAYDINTTIIATTEGAYQPALDQALAGGGSDAPDMYCAEAAFVLKYTQGDAAQYAATYKDLGIDIDKLLVEAQIAPYASEIGTRGSDVVGLPYQATGGAFIYRRSIAKDVWGTDDPATIKDKVGPGWDKFLSAAADLKAKGYAIVSGVGDVWHPLENSSEKGWIVDDKLFIDPDREYLLDLAKELKDNGYMNDTADWNDPWFADMKDAQAGDLKKVLGFFGPAWLINYVMAGNSGVEKDENDQIIRNDDGTIKNPGTYGDWAVCEPTAGFSWGGTWVIANKDTQVKEGVAELIEWITLDSSETGLQYYWANGTLYGEGGTKDTVASGAVMSKSNGELEFLGGQNMFDVFVPAGETAKGTNKTQMDESINSAWRDQVTQYITGNKTRDQAIADFKQTVKDNLDIAVD